MAQATSTPRRRYVGSCTGSRLRGVRHVVARYEHRDDQAVAIIEDLELGFKILEFTVPADRENSVSIDDEDRLVFDGVLYSLPHGKRLDGEEDDPPRVLAFWPDSPDEDDEPSAT